MDSNVLGELWVFILIVAEISLLIYVTIASGKSSFLKPLVCYFCHLASIASLILYDFFLEKEKISGDIHNMWAFVLGYILFAGIILTAVWAMTSAEKVLKTITSSRS